jgi:hypothetical protein
MMGESGGGSGGGRAEMETFIMADLMRQAEELQHQVIMNILISTPLMQYAKNNSLLTSKDLEGNYTVRVLKHSRKKCSRNHSRNIILINLFVYASKWIRSARICVNTDSRG